MKLAEEARALREQILDKHFKGPESHGLTVCEKKIEKCIQHGHSEEECKASVKCP